MKTNRWIIAGIVVSIILVVVTYLFATSLMDSLYAYRSPFASQPPQAGKPIGKPLSRRVVSILVDGLRVDTAANKQVMPFLNSLREKGASAVTHSGVPSYSAPSWSVLAIGAWPDLSDGPAMNPTEPKDYITWTQDNIFTAVHNAGLHTAVAANQNFQHLVQPSSLDAYAWTVEETSAADQQNINSALAFIQSGKYDYIFTYAVQVDDAGHNEGGPQDQRWNEAAARADHLIEQIVNSLDLRLDTVLIYSDHGQIPAGGHGGQDPVVLIQPFIMAGANVKPGVYADIHQVDIAATTAVLLGANIPAVSQGHPQIDMLDLSDSQLADVRQAVTNQQSGLYQAYAQWLGVPAAQISLTQDQDPVTIYQAALLELKNNRLNRERLPRFSLIILIVLLPLYFFYRHRGRSLALIFGAVVIYLAGFHSQYALMHGGTYTLSTVLSASNLISTTALYTGLAFLAAWLVVFFGLRLYSLPALQAAGLHMFFSFTLFYVISLPVLWSLAYNGALVGWTLPDVASMFFGFIFTLQLLVSASVSLLLLVVTLLVTRLVRKA